MNTAELVSSDPTTILQSEGVNIRVPGGYRISEKFYHDHYVDADDTLCQDAMPHGEMMVAGRR